MGTSRARFWAAVALAAATVPSGLACIWDGDTLAAEVRHRGYLVLDALTGRFDRLPPEYYRKRYEIASERIAKDPSALAAYDNAAVACERLGRTDEAIDWMLKKQAAMEALPVHDRAARDDARYRFHANIGTFYAHRWVAGGAKRDDPDALAALDHLTKCMAINPEAHFGREVVQLGMIEWLNSERKQPLGDHLAERVMSSVPYAVDSSNNVLAEGLAGLVLFGRGLGKRRCVQLHGSYAQLFVRQFPLLRRCAQGRRTASVGEEAFGPIGGLANDPRRRRFLLGRPVQEEVPN